MWGCQHFQAQDNCALFPRCIGKIINIPGVCFQAALWNKSQTVVVSLGSLVPQNCVFSLHESLLTAPPKRGVMAPWCSGWMRRRCWRRSALHPRGSESPPRPLHLLPEAAWTDLSTWSSAPGRCLPCPGPDSTMCCRAVRQGVCPGAQGLPWKRLGLCGSQQLFPSPFLGVKEMPRECLREAMALPEACGNVLQQSPFRCGGTWPSPSWHRVLGLVKGLILEVLPRGRGGHCTHALVSPHRGSWMPWEVH